MKAIYLLANKKRLIDGDHGEEEFHPEDYEYPGWCTRMSEKNRGLSCFFPDQFQDDQFSNGFYYKESWVKKLVRVEP